MSDTRPGGLDVRFGPASVTKDAHGDVRTYEVLVRGESIGSVTGRRVRSDVPTGRGNRLRRTLGYPVRWSFDPDRVTPHPSSRLKFDTRNAAVTELVRHKLEQQQ